MIVKGEKYGRGEGLEASKNGMIRLGEVRMKLDKTRIIYSARRCVPIKRKTEKGSEFVNTYIFAQPAQVLPVVAFPIRSGSMGMTYMTFHTGEDQTNFVTVMSLVGKLTHSINLVHVG
jgi:hypothetical protein